MQISQELQEPMAAGFFPSKDGTLLHADWVAARGSVKGGVVIVHGFADHSGRYRTVAERLGSQGYAVMAYDTRGHGKAEGPRGYCERFTDFVDDLVAACEKAQAALQQPLVLMAQSHGALVALRALLDPQVTLPGVTAAVLTAPFLGFKLRVPAVKALAARVASKLHPRLSMPNGLDPAHFSHDEKVAEEYRADPLVHHVATARWFTETRAAQAYVARHIGRLSLPTLWLVAGDDRVVDSDVARAVFERAGGPKELLFHDGMFHELLNEVDATEVMAGIETWLAAHTDP